CATQPPAPRAGLESVRRPLYDPLVLLVGLVAALVLAWPHDALAWGPVTHLVHGSQVLDSLSTLGPALQEILRSHRLAYLYGFVAAQARDRWHLMRTVFEHRYPDCDRLVERVVERTLFSFKTNKRIFSSVMAVQRLGQWQRLMRGLSARSRYPLPRGEVERFNTLCIRAVQDLLARGRKSVCQHADPTGREALARADVLRRKLRALKRRGQMTEAI